MESTTAACKRELRKQLGERLAGARLALDKAAENLRKLPLYREASLVIVSLHPGLRQARLNVLFDRKFLLLPTPGLQKGFRLLEGGSIPISKRAMAVSPKFMSRYGRHLSCKDPWQPRIDLSITEVLAVADDGTCLGDGAGHLDLQVAVLQALGWLSPKFRIVALADAIQVERSLPAERHDVGAHWIVTDDGFRPGRQETSTPHPIWWEQLDRRAIRRNEALFVLNGLLRQNGSDSAAS
jgi:5-formyltetrahydrofolate cyclo-ligase